MDLLTLVRTTSSKRSRTIAVEVSSNGRGLAPPAKRLQMPSQQTLLEDLPVSYSISNETVADSGSVTVALRTAELLVFVD